MPESIRRTRILNQETVSRIAKYVVGNPTDYVLPSLLVSVGGDAHFSSTEVDEALGHLHVAMTSRMVVNGGEHERAAIERALAHRPALSDEKISVVFHLDKKLKRAGKIYADLKMFSARPSASLKLLHSTNDDVARLARELADQAKPFQGFVEMKRSTLSPRSKMLFTLSAVYQATKALFAGVGEVSYEERLATAVKFWNAVGRQFPEWQQVRSEKMLSSELRSRFIHSHALSLQAIGTVGNALLRAHPNDWERHLESLHKIDWQRTNAKAWEGRAFVGGKVSKAMANVVLTGNLIKKAIGLPLLAHEKAIEQAHKAGRSPR